MQKVRAITTKSVPLRSPLITMEYTVLCVVRPFRAMFIPMRQAIDCACHGAGSIYTGTRAPVPARSRALAPHTPHSTLFHFTPHYYATNAKSGTATLVQPMRVFLGQPWAVGHRGNSTVIEFIYIVLLLSADQLSH